MPGPQGAAADRPRPLGRLVSVRLPPRERGSRAAYLAVGAGWESTIEMCPLVSAASPSGGGGEQSLGARPDKPVGYAPKLSGFPSPTVTVMTPKLWIWSSKFRI